ncbi:hypothetical protein [Texcoconibacillus texcoconensis]|uniref:Uncharacterized protein n=1 Tax=Texcoconibacillus texcoconensis TaxID=1095777 RepID=A0A840QMU7_9BACI|nr:hypothetical protein [Texcoconibacillus texcoconensis]MBB5172705.1 hypothetical protein [Texcoconibacillus texcoconensis]
MLLLTSRSDLEPMAPIARHYEKRKRLEHERQALEFRQEEAISASIVGTK